MSITHNHPTSQVMPGESVRLTASLDWGAARLFWEMKGGVTATPNTGTASASAFPYPWYVPTVSAIINPGTPDGASIEGVHVRSGEIPFFGLQFPPFWSNLLNVVAFDWTAPSDPGPVTFAWTPDPSMPNPLLYPTATSQTPVPFPTTYVGTTLTVIPGPGAGVVLVVSVVVVGRRRRV